MNTPEANVPKRGNKMDTTIRQDRTAPPVHESRSYETWDDVSVHAEESKPWVRPTSLEAPPARPGFVQRWIRVGTMGQDDPTNTARKFREGWKPRPESSIPAGFFVPTIQHGRWTGAVGVEGMLLCEMPQKIADKRNAHYRAKTENTTNSLEAELQKHSTAAMPISQERKSDTRMVKMQDD